MTDSAAPAASTRSSFLKKWVWILAFAVGALSLTLLKTCQARTLQRLPVLYALPEFTGLRDQKNAEFGSKQLDGKVWIASFAFTSCKTECPIIGKALQQLQDKLAGTPIELVTITVDPEFDTPERMADWGKTFGADPARWHLLSGDRKTIEAIVIDGFRTHMGDRKAEGGLVQVAHTMKLVLVDQFRGIRHYFDALDDRALPLIVDHAKALATEGAAR